MTHPGIKNLCKYIIFSIATSVLFLSTVFTVFAATTVKDNAEYNSLYLYISDIQNGVNQFLIESNNSTDLFDSNGKEVKITFDIYDVNTDSSYTIGQNQVMFYGDLVTDEATFKILSGSYFNTVEDDDGFYDPDDPVHFKMRYDSSKNVIWIDENESGVTADDTDWDIESDTFIENIDGKIEMMISLKDSEGNAVTAKPIIIIKPEGITFDPGLDEGGDGDGDVTGGNVQNINKEVVKEIKFDGDGLKKPSSDAYKGISQEVNLEKFIVGLTNFALSFVAAIAVIMLIYGGYLWIVDQGDDQMNEKAKKIIAGSVIGILLIISAYTIVNTIIRLEGNTYEGCNSSFEIGNGTDFDMNCNTDSSTMVGAGLGGLIGGTLGGIIGGDDGALIGGLLGGVGGGIIGSP